MHELAIELSLSIFLYMYVYIIHIISSIFPIVAPWIQSRGPNEQQSSKNVAWSQCFIPRFARQAFVPYRPQVYSTDFYRYCDNVHQHDANMPQKIQLHILLLLVAFLAIGRGQYDDRWRFRRWSCIVLQANSAPVCLRCGHLLLLPGCSDSCHTPCHVFTMSQLPRFQRCALHCLKAAGLRSMYVAWPPVIASHPPRNSVSLAWNGYGSKLGTPKLWMVNTKLDIHICGPINGLPFWPTSKFAEALQTGWSATVPSNWRGFLQQPSVVQLDTNIGPNPFPPTWNLLLNMPWLGELNGKGDDFFIACIESLWWLCNTDQAR